MRRRVRSPKTRTSTSTIFATIAAFGLLGICAPASAWANGQGWAFGGGALYRSPNEVRGFILAERELWAYTGARLEAGAGGGQNQPAADVWLGPTLGLDIWSWVPSLFAGVGWRANPNALAGTVRLELKRYLSLHGALGLGVGTEWAVGQPLQLSAALIYHYAL